MRTECWFLLTRETLLLAALLILLNSARQGTITHRHSLLRLGLVAGVAALVRGDAINYTPYLMPVCGLLSAGWFGMRAWSLGK